MPGPRLTDLAKVISDNSSKLETYFDENKLQQPSFDEHAPPDLQLSPEMLQARGAVVSASLELHDLLIGPAMNLRPVLNATSLQAIYKFKVAEAVPLDSEISYPDLAQLCKLDEVDLRRIVRFASLYHRLFQEKTPGLVSHSAASRYLATSDEARAGLGFMFDECYQAFAHTTEALQKRKDTEPNQSVRPKASYGLPETLLTDVQGWAFAHNSDVPMWDYHSSHPEIGQRAAKAMASFTKGFNHDVSGLIRGYDWSATSGTVVDLGGADGQVGIEIARANLQLRCIIQDLPALYDKGTYQAPSDVSSRVEFQAHDFFKPQPVQADVYLFRQIFHNWSDKHCIEALRALIPSLRAGAKVVINDMLVPPPGVLPAMAERGIRSLDMIMLSLFNSREREASEWPKIFRDADARFQHVKSWVPQGSHLGITEATWTG